MISRTALVEFVASNVATAAETVTKRLLLEAVRKSAWPGYETLEAAAFEEATLCTLFVDMRGSTERAARIGAEKTFVTMHAYLPTIGYIVARYGGIVPQYRGDGVISVFGLPVAGSPRDAGVVVRNATYAAATIQHAVAQVVVPLLGVVHIEPFECGIGIDAGTVVVTRIVAPGSDETLCFGDSVNRASKLCESAQGSQVLITRAATDLWPDATPGGPSIVLAPQGSDRELLTVPWREMTVFST